MGFLLSILVLASIGCSRQHHSIIGTWSFDRAPSGSDVATQYKADGTWESWFNGTSIKTKNRGTYKLEGSRLTVTELESTSSAGVVTKKPGTPQLQTVRWINDNKLELISPEGAYKYSRRAD